MIKYVEKSSGLLFSTHDLHAIMGSQTAAMRAEVNAMDPNRLLNTSPADLAQYLAEKYRLRAPSLIRDAWSAAETETRIPVSSGNQFLKIGEFAPFGVFCEEGREKTAKVFRLLFGLFNRHDPFHKLWR